MSQCVSDPGRHHCVQSGRGGDWSVWTARFAAGIHWPPHHHSDGVTHRPVSLHHCRRQSWFPLGPVSTVRHLLTCLPLCLSTCVSVYSPLDLLTDKHLYLCSQVYFAHRAVCSVPESDVTSSPCLHQEEGPENHQSPDLQDVSC